MKNIKLMLLTAFILIAAVRCKKEVSGQREQQQKKIDLSKVFKTPSTPEEKLLVENLGKVTEVFKELYKDKSNLKVVNAAIFSKAFTDESVLLKHLIYPTDSWLNKVKKFQTFTQKWNVSLKQFASNFWSEVNKKNDLSFNKFLEKLNSYSTRIPNSANRTTTALGDEVSIYFPYSEQFLPLDDGGYYEPLTSIVTATADADEGWGQLFK